MNRLFSRISLAFAAVLLPTLSAAAPASANDIGMRITSQETIVGVPLTLSLEIPGAELQTAPRFPDIDGLTIRAHGTPSHSSSISIINGQRFENRSTTWQFRIVPHRQGVFEIPAISLNTDDGRVLNTVPFRISATTSESGDLMFAEVSGQVDRLFVGQPVELTLKIWLKPFRDRGVTLSQSEMFRILQEDSTWGPFACCLEPDAPAENTIRGAEVLRADEDGIERSYYQYEMDVTFYPKHAGQLEFEDMNLVAHYPVRLGKSRDPFDSMFDDSLFANSPFGGNPFDDDFFQRAGFSPFGRGHRVVQSRPLAVAPEVNDIQVVPVPEENRPADYRGAVGQYRIVTQATPHSVKAGDPVNLTIGIQGTGPMELVQAPPLHTLPALTADFKVSSNPLAGVVEDDIKVFSTTIRPRREGITVIPAIPFSFFDPANGEFVTVSSEPLPIEVDRAETLSLDTIAGGAAAPTGPSADQELAAAPLLEIRNGSGLLESRDSRSVSGLWWVWLGLPLAGLALLVLSRMRAPHSLRRTLRTIERAGNGSEIATALLELAAGKGHVEAGVSDRRSILVALEAVSDAGMTDQLNHLLDQCEMASFAGQARIPLASLKVEAADMARQMGRLRGSKPQTASRHNPWRVLQPALVPALVMCLATAAFVWTLGVTHRESGSDPGKLPTHHGNIALKLDHDQQVTLLQEATDAWQQGMQQASADPAMAQESFARSADRYRMLVNSGIANPGLYFNLGNASLQAGADGQAIANYRRALNLNPLDQAARHNLEYVQQKNIAEAAAGSGTGPLGTLFSLVNRIPVSWWMSLLAAGWLGICATMAIRLIRPGCPTRFVTAASLVLVLVAAGWLTWASSQQPLLPEAVVVTNDIAVHEGSSPAFPRAADLQLQEGQSVEMIQQRDNWIQVRDHSGGQGWVPASCLEPV